MDKYESQLKRKRSSRRYFLAKMSLWAGILLCLLASGLFVLTPEHFGGYSIVITVGVGGLFGIVSIFQHHESKNKRLFQNQNKEEDIE